MKEKTVWNAGPPTEIGWWPAGIGRDIYVVRWWDGAKWSSSAKHTDTAELAASSAEIVVSDWLQTQIVWSERWWLVNEK
jgi:hypothetical protein